MGTPQEVVDDLKALWEGDELSTGYQHPALVVELCRYAPQSSIPGVQWVLNHLRSHYPRADEAHPEELTIIERGLQIWRDLGEPRYSTLKELGA